MPVKFIVPPDQIDTSQVLGGVEEVEKYIPHRFEIRQLEAILRYDPANKIAIGYKDQREDEFWVRGHIPGRPIMPGVLMAEAAAQLCTYYYKRHTQDERFMAFGGLNNVKFRGTVVPGDRLILVVRNTELRSRRMKFDAQAIVGDRLVFEGEIIGMPI